MLLMNNRTCCICKKEYTPKDFAYKSITCSCECSKINKAKGIKKRFDEGRYDNFYKSYRENKKELLNKRSREWYQKNKKLVNDRCKERRLNDVNYRMKGILRQSLYRVALNGGRSKYIKFSFDDLKNHLESKFEEGMSWENYGKNGWHIDHVKPLSSFNFFNKYGEANINEIEMAFSIENLQPLWAKDNYTKGARI